MDVITWIEQFRSRDRSIDKFPVIFSNFSLIVLLSIRIADYKSRMWSVPSGYRKYRKYPITWRKSKPREGRGGATILILRWLRMLPEFTVYGMVFKIQPTIVGIRFVVNLRSPSGSYNIRRGCASPNSTLKHSVLLDVKHALKRSCRSFDRSFMFDLSRYNCSNSMIELRISFVELDYPVRRCLVNNAAKFTAKSRVKILLSSFLLTIQLIDK